MSARRSLVRASFATWLGVLGIACGDGEPAGAHENLSHGDAAASAADAGVSKVTYYQDIKPIVDAKCVRCHVAGTVAPFVLDSYESAKTAAELSRKAINDGVMPPWKFDNDCNEYKGNFSLTAQEKALFNAWVDQKTPEGDAAHPAPKLDIGEKGLSRVDVTLKMAEAYTPTLTPDEYRCFPIKWPERYTSTVFMTGFRAVPGNPRVVHHVEVYHVGPADAQKAFDKDTADPGPGYTCFGGPGVTTTGTVGGWAPGSPGYDYPPNVGVEIPAGSVMVVQLHYNMQTIGKAEPDQSAVEFKVDEQAAAGGYDFWANPSWSAGQMPIPANNADVPVAWTGDPTFLNMLKPIRIYTAALHMHNLGTSGFMYIKKKDGTRKCMIKINDWDFHWQGFAHLAQPIDMDPGDSIEMECRFDNSAQNQPVYQGMKQAPRDVNWGENTTDEMCLGLLLWGPR